MNLVIIALTAAQYADRRQACRDTWAKHLPPDVAIHFVRGFADTQEQDEWLVPCPDTYPELPQKTRHALIKALRVYPDCPYFFKCDDDSFVHLPRLVEYAASNPGDYCGHAMNHEFPAFASGGAGYLLSRKAATIVADTLTDERGSEDLLVSRCLLNAKIPLTPCPRFHPWNNPVPTLDNDQITAHYQTPNLMRQTWGNLQGQKIPKRFHWIWVGGKSIPPQFVNFMHGWIEKHPSWRSTLWTDDTMPRLRNQAEYDAAKTPAQKADIARYELLYEHGGVYLDTDMECFKNIEPLLQGINGFSAAEDDSTVAIGVMGAVPQHPLYAELIQALPASFAEYENVVNACGPGFFSRYCLGRSDFKIFLPHVFYPKHYTGHRFGPDELAYATHHWSHSWAS